MHGPVNIMERRRNRCLSRMGMVVAGFVSMVAGLCMGSFLTEVRADRAEVHGLRKYTALKIAYAGPQSVRQAAMAAMADGILTVREERHLYMIADEIRRENDVREAKKAVRSVSREEAEPRIDII